MLAEGEGGQESHGVHIQEAERQTLVLGSQFIHFRSQASGFMAPTFRLGFPTSVILVVRISRRLAQKFVISCVILGPVKLTPNHHTKLSYNGLAGDFLPSLILRSLPFAASW